MRFRAQSMCCASVFGGPDWAHAHADADLDRDGKVP